VVLDPKKHQTNGHHQRTHYSRLYLIVDTGNTLGFPTNLSSEIAGPARVFLVFNASGVVPFRVEVPLWEWWWHGPVTAYLAQ
jgi:hypothetical protein